MNLSRRALLRGLGGVALGLPLLQTLPRAARAQGAFPKRLVVFFNPNGTLKELWSPRGGTETDFALSPLLAPLERHKQDLVIFDGVDMAVADTGPGGPHNRGMATLLTGEIILPGNFADGDGQTAGWAGGPSIDQLLADRLAPPTRFRTLELGVRAIENEPRARISYRGADQPVPPENQPLNVYTRLFAGMNQDPEVMRRLLVQRRSVLDVVREDFARLNAKLAPEDRRKLEQHAESVRQLERSGEQAPMRGDGMRGHAGQCTVLPGLFHEAHDLLGHLGDHFLLRAGDGAAVFGHEHRCLADVDIGRGQRHTAGGKHRATSVGPGHEHLEVHLHHPRLVGGAFHHHPLRIGDDPGGEHAVGGGIADDLEGGAFLDFLADRLGESLADVDIWCRAKTVRLDDRHIDRPHVWRVERVVAEAVAGTAA